MGAPVRVVLLVSVSVDADTQCALPICQLLTWLKESARRSWQVLVATLGVGLLVKLTRKRACQRRQQLAARLKARPVLLRPGRVSGRQDAQTARHATVIEGLGSHRDVLAQLDVHTGGARLGKLFARVAVPVPVLADTARLHNEFTLFHQIGVAVELSFERACHTYRSRGGGSSGESFESAQLTIRFHALDCSLFAHLATFVQQFCLARV